MANNGWIKLYRELLDKPIFENEKLLKVFTWCLLKATHKERNQLIGRQIVKLKPGQFVTGRNKASKELNIPPSTTWEYLKLIEINGTINIKSNNKYSVITIENWRLYQSDEDISDNKQDNKRTTNQQQIDTNKNVKNDKNIYSYQDSHLDIAKKLQLLILEVNLGNRCKNANLEKWANDIRLMQEKDERTDEELHSMIKYIFNKDDFWRVQIQSPSNLRKHWDKIYPRINQDTNKQSPNAKKDEYDPYKNFKRL